MTKIRTTNTLEGNAHSVPASVRPRRVFAPNLWLTLLTITVVLATALLSRWQFGRAAQKEAMQAQMEQQSTNPPLASLKNIDPQAQRYARVAIPGTFDRSKTLLHDNQIQDKRPGMHAYALFRPQADGPALLVNRGWLPLPADRALIANPDTPTQNFTLVGRINTPAARTKRLADNTDSAQIVQTIELAELQTRFGEPLAPFIVEQTEFAGDTLVRAWPAPNFKIDTHKMYAGQWGLFSALAFGLWFVYSFKKRA